MRDASLQAMSEVESQLGVDGSRGHVMSPAKGREEVVECYPVGNVDRRYLKAPPIFVAAEKVVISDCDIKQVAGTYSGWVMVVVLSARSGDLYEGGAV